MKSQVSWTKWARLLAVSSWAIALSLYTGYLPGRDSYNRLNNDCTQQNQAPCGHCESCLSGQSSYCSNRRDSFLGLTNDGGYAQYVVCGSTAFVGVPEGFTAVEAASVMCTFGTVWHAAITRGRLQAGERLVITGATGGVGSAAVQIAKAMVQYKYKDKYIHSNTMVAGLPCDSNHIEREQARLPARLGCQRYRRLQRRQLSQAPDIESWRTCSRP